MTFLSEQQSLPIGGGGCFIAVVHVNGVRLHL
jgi:hypothetical protein